MTAFIAALLLPALALAQATGAAPPPVEQDRLRVCLDTARTDPATAITTASQWASEANGAEVSLPRQCLGVAYMSLLRWDAAEQAFTEARDARLSSERALRARFGAMAGNAALAGETFPRAAELLQTAQADAEAAGESELAGQIAADRARALVAADRIAEAQSVLDGAQVLAPQTADVWLLSATLARREGNLAQAGDLIRIAARLAPEDPATALELGLIAALAGDQPTARKSWQTVRALAPDTPLSHTADTYLARLDGRSETP